MAIQSLFPPYPDPVVEPDRLMRRSWVGFFQGWIALWDALLLQVRDLEAAVAALLVNPVGATIDVPYNPLNFTTDVAGVWTVPVGSLFTYQYKLIGDWLTVNVFIYGTSVSGTTGRLFVAIPNGYVSKTYAIGKAWSNDNGVAVDAYHYVTPGAEGIQFSRDDNAAWAASAGSTAIGAAVSFQIVRP